jgi:hypothetical protein
MMQRPQIPTKERTSCAGRVVVRHSAAREQFHERSDVLYSVHVEIL